ncbi:MAG TPA: Hsp70 family protein [Candidatus Limnocylindria bacterium]|nr:Hsp70 family protein [Candidatus Limnocylindria bacterium]
MRFGLDFGTSNTSLAVWDGAATHVLALDPIAGETMPTVLYVRRDGETLVGRPAIDAYLGDNRSRGPLTREFRMLGIRMASSDPEQPTVEAHIYTDAHAPGRLFQALKTFLGDPLDARTNVFGAARGLEELIALILAHVRTRAKELTGVAPEEIALGRPVRFIGAAGADERATSRLRAAAELAGFREVRFVREPIAAAHAADVAPGTSLVFDFGGGTLDLCVVRREARGLAVLATAGGPVGGDRATELVIDDAVAPRLGSRAVWGPKRLALPRYIVNALRDWHALSSLNEKPLLDALDDLVRAGAPRRELAALRSAIELQLGYEIFQAADATKIELSTAASAILSYHRAAVDVDARVMRGRFERLIAPLLEETAVLVRRVVADAEIEAANVGAIVYTGGSSAIPAFRTLMRDLLPNAVARDTAAFTSVAAGLAMPGVEEAAATA